MNPVLVIQPANLLFQSCSHERYDFNNIDFYKKNFHILTKAFNTIVKRNNLSKNKVINTTESRECRSGDVCLELNQLLSVAINH